MKAIDLHIHTKPGVSDANFEFDINVLKNYIESLKLDVIAITNHNLFDRKQFDEIIKHINIDVFPGIEVDLEGGHILVISPLEAIDDFEQECAEVESLIVSPNDYLSLEDFKRIFKNRENYLLIPHYKKKPVIKESVLKALENDIFVGEVGNPKKFEIAKKDSNALVPTLFSDERICVGLTNFKVRITFLNIDDININNLKIALSDRSNVFTDENGCEESFIFLKDGTAASTKLNVVMGKRSSGKTYTLKTINKTFEKENIKFIKQFEITSQCEDSKFDAMLERDYSNIVENYLSEIKKIIPSILEIDLLKNDKEVNDYIDSLKENAFNQSKNNSFSKAKIFSESKFDEVENREINNLLTSVKNVIDNQKYKSVIEKHLEYNQLKKLFIDLENRYRKERIEYKLKEEADIIISSLKNKLAIKSSIEKIEDINLYEIIKNKKTVSEFNQIINKLKEPKKITDSDVDLFRFKINVSKKPFKNGSDIRSVLKTQDKIAPVFNVYYNDPYTFLKKLKEEGLPENLLYKTLIKIDMELQNEHGFDISGGERAEFILLKELESANKYDMLLIDELEPSFDNVFLRKNIIERIKEISNKTTTFITTHNNSLGISIRPDKIIYTLKDEDKHDVFTATLTSDLISKSGKQLPKKATILDVMEAGVSAYDERKLIYENFKD